MLTSVKIVLGIVLVILIIAALGVWWVIRKFKHAMKGLKEVLDAKPMHPPCRVNPLPEPNPQWRNPEAIKKFSDEFLAHGFTALGAFTLPEVGGLQLAAFVHEGERLYGVAYDHEKLPPNIDIVGELEDGGELSGSNTTFGDTVDRRPEVIAIRLDGGGVKELLAAVQAHPAPAPRKPVAGADFATYFRTTYARTMNWRMKRGGVTREEIRRQAQKDGTELTEEQFEEVYQEQRATYMTELQAGCLAQYLDDQKPAAAEWDEIQDRVFAVPAPLTEAEVRELLELHCELDEEQTHRLEQIKLSFSQTALDFMHQVMDGNIGSLGLKRLGTVQEPVPAEIFLVELSEEDDHSDGED
jgi:hypothetical protein